MSHSRGTQYWACYICRFWIKIEQSLGHCSVYGVKINAAGYCSQCEKQEEVN